MKKRNIRKRFLALFVVFLMCLQPMLVHAANNGTIGDLKAKRLMMMTDVLKKADEAKASVHALKEAYYNENNKFGYDAYTPASGPEGVQVLVNDIVLTKGHAASSVGVVLEKGVKLILENGYSLKDYKVVCAENAEQAMVLNSPDPNEKVTETKLKVNEKGEILITFDKITFGHTDKETTYWLLLDVVKSSTAESTDKKDMAKTGEADTAENKAVENKVDAAKTGEADAAENKTIKNKVAIANLSKANVTDEKNPIENKEETGTPEPTPASDEKISPYPSENPEPVLTKEFAVSIIWEDADNQDGLRPKEIKFQLYADDKASGETITLNADNGWKHTIKDLPMKTSADAEKEIVYTIKTEAVPAGYTEAIAATGTEAKVTYNHTLELADIVVQNVWNDKENQDGKRPSEIKIQLYANGKAIGDETVLNANNSWKHTFANLDKYDAGKAVSYTIKVVSVPTGYTEAYTTAADGALVVTHTHEVEKADIPVKITWSDSNNQDGIRPANAEVQLYADSKAVGNTVKVTADGQWKYTFEDIDVYAAGKKISYTIKAVNIAKGYTSSVKNTNGEWVITQSHTPEKINVAIEIKWDDDNNKTKDRPTEVKIQLYANGVKQGSEITVKSTANWKYTYKNLAKYKDGKEISYTVKQVNLSTKYKEYVKGYTITNVIATKVAAKTADHAGFVIWIGIMAASVVCMGNVFLYKKRRRTY